MPLVVTQHYTPIRSNGDIVNIILSVAVFFLPSCLYDNFASHSHLYSFAVSEAKYIFELSFSIFKLFKLFQNCILYDSFFAFDATQQYFILKNSSVVPLVVSTSTIRRSDDIDRDGIFLAVMH